MGRLTNYFQNNRKVGKFGIKYLDDKLKGILKGDLILIGARSGAGKSSLADMIAQYNANNDFKVHIFSLENFTDDAFVTKAYYEYKRLTGNWDLNLRDFASGDFQIDTDKLIEAEKYAEECYKNVGITTRQKGYGIAQLKNDIIHQVKDNGVSLLIIDHLDYVDKDNPNENDNSHITELMKTIRELQDEFKVAVVAISHLRKNMSTKDLPIIPSIDEFIGSSNKVKESTVVIMVAPDDEENEDNQSFKKVTWFSIKKLRMGGVDNKNGKLWFNRRNGTYEPEYEEYVVRGKKKEKVA